ncbi:MAG: GNAT family N-acetyltransferase [Candidatus Shapirobacteria bacterium]|nr:GNAT family N-acetyltransferase [Candidatus Shapirobacteria bacterium]
MDESKGELYGSWSKSELPKTTTENIDRDKLVDLAERVQKDYEESFKRESKYRNLLMTGLATELEKPIILSKSDLMHGIKGDKTVINPDDEIEFKPTMNDEGQAVLLIRNKTLAERGENRKPEGEIKRLTPDEVADFCWRNSEQKNMFHLEEILRSRTFDEDQKFFGFLGSYRDVLGVAYITEANSGRSASLVRLFTVAAEQGRGIARNLIESLKLKYRKIDLVSRTYVSDENRPTDGLTAEKLREFYIKSGFIAGSPFIWKDDCLSLDDITNARNWREFRENDSVGFSNKTVAWRETINAFFYRVDETMPPELTRETKGSLFGWESAISDSRNQKNDLNTLTQKIRGE